MQLAGSEVTTLKLAERGSRRSHGLWVLEVRKRSETSRQTSLWSCHDRADYTALAVSMLARWSQENFYQYLWQHWDRLAEYGTEPVPDPIQGVHPAGRKLDSQIRAHTETRRRQLALLGALDLQSSLEEPEVARYQQTKLNCNTRLRTSTATSTSLRGSGKKRLLTGPGSTGDRPLKPTAHRTEAFTLKLIAYRTETSRASLLRDQLSREDDTGALLPQIYATEVDLIPDFHPIS